MARFLEIQDPNCREILHRPPSRQSNTCLFTKKRRKPRKSSRTCTRETKSFLFPNYGNSTELGPPGLFVTSLDSSGSVGPAGLKPGLSIQTHLSHEQDNPHTHNKYNYGRGAGR